MKSLIEIKKIVAKIQTPLLDFKVGVKGCVFFLQGSYYEPDTYTGIDNLQKTRKWIISQHMTESEIVQTALACLLMSMEHRARESFMYKKQRVFGPHFNVNRFVELAARADLDVRQ
jgi:hypothetical protein